MKFLTYIIVQKCYNNSTIHITKKNIDITVIGDTVEIFIFRIGQKVAVFVFWQAISKMAIKKIAQWCQTGIKWILCQYTLM
jgi:hypothetical protein